METIQISHDLDQAGVIETRELRFHVAPGRLGIREIGLGAGGSHDQFECVRDAARRRVFGGADASRSARMRSSSTLAGSSLGSCGTN